MDACLEHYNDSVELVVAHIFDGSLHSSLQAMEQGMARPSFTRSVRVAAPAVIPYIVEDASDARHVVKVHYGKKYAPLSPHLYLSLTKPGQPRRRKTGSRRL